MLKRVIFAIDEEKVDEGANVLPEILQRQISYFADEDGLNALLRHLGGSRWCQVLQDLRDSFDESHPRKPFSQWEDIDADFADLTGGLTNFDPAKRLTAHEALAHTWFIGP